MFKSCSVFVLLYVVSFFGNAQQSKYVHHLVDTLPKDIPVFVNFDVEEGFMATERIAISKNGKSIYYGVRDGYDSISKAHVLKIDFNGKTWSKPQIVFADSSGAPAFSRNEKTMYFQHDHAITPKGLVAEKTKRGWSAAKLFHTGLRKSHYLQSPKKHSYYYSAGINADENIQDIFHITTTASDTITTALGFNHKGEFIDFYIDPDESFIILLISKKHHEDDFTFFGNSNLFISFKKDDETWTRPKNLGKKVHSISEWNWGPYVTNDKKYLFFSSWAEKVGTYMVAFKPIYDRLKPN